MKKLIAKELREQLPLASLGLVIFSLLLALCFSGARSTARSISQTAGWATDASQVVPLLTDSTFLCAGVFCGLFGGLLGFRQMHAERHPDLWAFLMHRPVSPATLLLAKLVGGLILYLAAAGLPVAAVTLIASIPGQMPAPFEWGMARPLIILTLGGLVAYGAGMITALRQARWYGSRGCALGLPLIAPFLSIQVPEFWQAAGVVILAGVVIAFALWGTYRTRGTFRGQPLVSKVALALTTTVSAFLACGALCGLLINLLSPDRDTRFWNYQLTTDGTWLRLESGDSENIAITLPDGTPWIDPATGQRGEPKSVQQRLASGIFVSLPTRAVNGWRHDEGYARRGRYFQPLQVKNKVLWYLTARNEIVGYHGVTRRQVNSIQSPEDVGGDPADVGLRKANSYQPGFEGPETIPILASRRAIYAADVGAQELRSLFTCPPGDRILELSKSYDYGTPPPPLHIVIASEHALRRIDSTGRLLFTLPYESFVKQYPNITAFTVTSSPPYIVRFDPDYRLNADPGSGLPTKVTSISSSGTVLATVDLPKLPKAQYSRAIEKMSLALVPPLLLTGVDLGLPRIWNFLPLTISVGLGLVCLGLARGSQTSWTESVAWMVLVSLMGPAGFLAWLALREIPMRVPCPACGRLRAVNRDHCENCEATFAPPPRNGFEIFQPLHPSA